ncbi:MAG: MG2 domain-containing protein [Planctomycetota bacterium]|nr:MG2 domain-containing protein [Planctomycetota bacterium]
MNISSGTLYFPVARVRRTLHAIACWAIAMASSGIGGPAIGPCVAAPPDHDPQRTRAAQLMQDGNYKDAYVAHRSLVTDPQVDPQQVGNDLGQAIACLLQLGRIDEADELLEQAVQIHARNWRLLQAAAQQYLNIDHHGFLIAGKFVRGQHRGGGRMVHAVERDRVRALQLLVAAIPSARLDDQKQEVAALYLQLAQSLLNQRGHYEAWRLQYLTDLSQLPDYDEGYHVHRSATGAPVDESGAPVFHRPSERWETAKTDGERWRWALQEAVENHAPLMMQVRYELAAFLYQQFGEQTLAHGPIHPLFRHSSDEKDTPNDESGTYALHTLQENETIARLANGIKRIRLPDEFNFLLLYQAIAKDESTPYAELANDKLAEISENRRQYPAAAAYWRESIRRFGDPQGSRQKRLDQIVRGWGEFESQDTHPAGKGATLLYRYRNATKLRLQAQAIDVERLLKDVKDYLKAGRGRLDGDKLEIENLGHRMVTRNEERYVGKQVATWEVDLQPRENHFDQRISVATPLQAPGAYLITAQLQDGNASKLVLWVADTAIVKKVLDKANLYFVADAVTGAPIPRANLEFFGYEIAQNDDSRFKVNVRSFAEFTNDDGQVIPDAKDQPDNHQWLIVARTKDQRPGQPGGGRFAFHGFRHVWTAQYYDAEYNETKAIFMTDRPVYRPGQPVHFKFWIGQAKYDQSESSAFAEQSYVVEVYDAKGEKINEQTLTTDAYGGAEGKLTLAADCSLGQFQLALRNGSVQVGGNMFRVEEYKKPEFEVTIEAPKVPVMLGESVTATIKAQYYFGGPVTEGTIKYKIMRTAQTESWYPRAPWDWCYGGGYWWYAYDYPWYRGWKNWVGCVRPIPWWWGWFPQNPPELVAEQEVPIGPDGTAQVQIDTQIAKALHPDQDHQYSITAEVRDPSRRVIVGQGTVLVARKPFKVYTWVDRGYYRTGETVHMTALAQTMDRQPVSGKGQLTLMKVTYDPQREPIETPVERWDVETNADGQMEQALTAAAPGQYRLAITVTDSQGHTIEGGYLFTVIGPAFESGSYRFNDLELIPDKREYAPGDTVRLQINTDRPDATVLLFVRPANGVCLPPRTLRIHGKSTVAEIAVVTKDMPNFFVEALTLSDAQVHNETKEIVVPPSQKSLNVEVLPSATALKPGEETSVRVHVTDAFGENVVGSTVVTIYDKSVEYIAGGSNVPDIREFFWKWRRHHSPQTESSLDRTAFNLSLPNDATMQPLGIFGATVADDKQSEAPKSLSKRALGRRENLNAFFSAEEMAAPMAADAGGAAVSKDSVSRLNEGGEDGGTPLVEPTVRSEFADTALWVGALQTDAQGVAEVKLKMPENLTTWMVRVWGMAGGTQVGAGSAEMITSKNLIVRLQSPRFFIEKDQVTLSANVHNYLATEKSVTVSLELPGQETLRPRSPLQQVVTVAAGGQQRIDWTVDAVREGVAIIRMKAQSDEDADAVEMQFPVQVHGMLKTESWAGSVRPDATEKRVEFTVPSQRRPEQSLLEVRYSPSLALAMVDALPYLVDYPYGCTEQTLNRFLPTVITQNVLQRMNLDLADILQKRTNLNAQEVGSAEQRAAQWRPADWKPERNPVFDKREVERMVKQGVQRLTNMQNQDGGWGWFSGTYEQSYAHTTAVVVHGLQMAQQNDVAIVPDTLERGVEWLQKYQAEQLQMLARAAGKQHPYKSHADDLDALVAMVLSDANRDAAEMLNNLYRDRNHLSVYSKAMLGLVFEKAGDRVRLEMILRNLNQFLVQDDENDTAYLRLPEGSAWWYWHGSDIEANAYYLKLLARTEPQGAVAPRLVKYLLNNRKHATYWNSTRDTSICIEAFADYLKTSQETLPDMSIEVLVDGKKRHEVTINAKNLFTFDNRFALTGADVTDGKHEVTIRRRGKGPVYFNVYATHFTLEDPIKAAGLEVKVGRRFFRLVREEKEIPVAGGRGQVAGQRVEKYRREPLENLAVVSSGDLIEIELEIDSKNDYEYVMFEDMKVAGMEPVDVRSGYTQDGLGAYMELRDNRVVFFLRQLPRGKHSVAYRMRAETPGTFSALPTQASAMYAPELRGNADEFDVTIADR